MEQASQWPHQPVLSFHPVNVSSVCKVVETLQMFKSCRSWQVELRECRREGDSSQSSFLPPTHQSNGRSGKYIDDLFSVLNIEANIETILPSHPSVTILYLYTPLIIWQNLSLTDIPFPDVWLIYSMWIYNYIYCLLLLLVLRWEFVGIFSSLWHHCNLPRPSPTPPFPPSLPVFESILTCICVIK